MVCINHKEKERLRKIAYKQKITMSQYIRHLIDFAIAINDLNILDNKKSFSSTELEKIVMLLGGHLND